MYTRNRAVLKSHPEIIKWGIQIVSQTKYLGVTIDCKLDWYPHTLYLERKVLRIQNSLARCSTATWGMTYHNHIPSHHIRRRGLVYLGVQKSQKQTAAKSDSLPYLYNESLQISLKPGSISNCGDNAHRTSHAIIQRQKSNL